MIAPHFAPAVAVLLGLALIPTITHNYVGLRLDDGRVTNAIDTRLAGLAGVPTERRAAWAKARFDSDDWIERWYTSDVHRLRLFVARSYDPKRLYHHPELAVAYGDGLESRGRVRFPERPAVPVHLLESRTMDRRGVGLYALLHDDTFVDDPIRFQLLTSASLLVRGRQQMTLFFVHETDVPADTSFEDLTATRLLFEAIDSFLEQPPSE